jgi:hypothetical protein
MESVDGMKATIYIHVGMHKTGTSSIQSAFFRNQRRLLSHDINYLSIDENHSWALFSLFCDQPHLYYLNRREAIDTEEKAAAHNGAIDAALGRELQHNTCSRFVVSGEALFRLTPAGIARLKQRFEPFAERFKIIVYVREPYSFINSAFQEGVRAGFTFDHMIHTVALPRYRRIRLFIDAFGRSAVDVRVFDRTRLVGGDLIADFIAAVDAPAQLADFLAGARTNEALSHEAALILNEINKQYPQSEPAQMNLQRDPRLPDLLRAVPGQPFHCPHAAFVRARPKIVRELEWLNALLGERVFSDECPATSDDLAPDWSDDTLRSIGVLINQLAMKERNQAEQLAAAELMTRRRWAGLPRLYAALTEQLGRLKGFRRS